MTRVVAIALLVFAFSGLAHADWTASGVAQYRDREFGPGGFTGVEPLKPIRSADVQVLDATSLEILATGTTDDSGAFSVPVIDAAIRDVQIRILTESAHTPDLHLEVVTAGSDPYAIAGPVVESHAPDADVDVGTLVAEIGAGGEAFNCYDVGLMASDFIAYLQGSRPNNSDGLTIVWEAARGNGVSYATFWQLEIRDTGAYDDTVILHEYGHFAVFRYSDSDNPGGAHGFSQCDQDPQLAWEEGHASFFGAAVRRHFGQPLPNIYVRTTGAPGPGHVSLYADLETESQYECDGNTGEVAIFTALWDVFDDAATEDFTPGVEDSPLDMLALDVTEHWEVMTGSLPGRTRITSEDYWDAWFEAPVQNGFLPEMVSIFGDGVRIEYFEDAGEPNGDAVSATPLDSVGTPFAATFFVDPDGDGSGASLADTDWYAFEAVEGEIYLAETFGLLSAADTRLTVRDGTGAVLADNDDRPSGGPSSAAQWTSPSTGTFYLEVVQPDDFTPYGSYSVRVMPSNDFDLDGVPNEEDTCPLDAANDVDRDGACGDVDNCATLYNPSQADRDADVVGDRCDLADGLVYLWFDSGDRVDWQEESGFNKWNTYRGDLAVLRAGGPVTQDPASVPLALRRCKDRDAWMDDAEPLPAGAAVFYLTAGVSGSSEADLGPDSSGTPRVNAHPCP